jgi:hypothetical protein
MLNDWAIHHLHLGPSGTDTVLMCHITDDALFAIGFWSHGEWSSFEIIKAMLDAWPEQFESRRIRGVDSPNLTNDQYANLRSKNMNAPFGHAGKVYAGIGGGLVSSGANMAATIEYDHLVHRLKNLQKLVQEDLAKQGVTDSSRLVLIFEGVEPLSLIEPSTGHRIAFKVV